MLLTLGFLLLEYQTEVLEIIGRHEVPIIEDKLISFMSNSRMSNFHKSNGSQFPTIKRTFPSDSLGNLLPPFDSLRR